MNTCFLDSKIVPCFYVLARGGEDYPKYVADGCVLANVAERPLLPGWVNLGVVSEQTPIGQGPIFGFQVVNLRKATTEEVLRALRQNHPLGCRYRPPCQEAQAVSDHLIMAGAIRNWTNDDLGGAPPIIDASREELLAAGKKVLKSYRKLMRHWGRICRGQIRTIRKQLLQPGQSQ